MLKLCREKGIDEAQKQLRWRCSVSVPLGVAQKDVDEAVDKIKSKTIQTVLCMATMALRDEFDFGTQRLQRFVERFNLKCECLSQGYIDWDDIITTLSEECGLHFDISDDIMTISRLNKGESENE